MFDFLFNLFAKIIEFGGYWGIILLMTMESMIFPVPSEAVMPFAGFLLYQNKMSFILIFIFSLVGSLLGSVMSYFIGFYGGRPLLIKYGKYLFLNEHHLSKTEKFFNRFGAKAIFFSRFIPIVRHLISILAGIGKMNFGRFLIYTAFGAGLWNGFLVYLGFVLGKNWTQINKISHIFDVLLLIILSIAIFKFLSKQKKNKQ